MEYYLKGTECPMCGEVDGKCRTLKTRRVTDNHMARIDAYYSPEAVQTRKMAKYGKTK